MSKILKRGTIFFIICLFFSCSIRQKKCVKLLKTASEKTYDAIVVTGYPFQGEEWDRIMKARVYWAKHLYDKGIAKNIIFSGGAVYSPYYEAVIMKLYALEMGIPEEHILVDTFAEHSTENAYYSYKLGKQHGFESFALATDPFQAKQIKRFIKKRVSRDMDIIPIIWDTMEVLNERYKEPIINPESAFRPGFVSIIERETLSQRWKGTRGKKLREDIYNSDLK